MKRIFAAVITVLISGAILTTINITPVNAVDPSTCTGGASILGLPAWYNRLLCPDGEIVSPADPPSGIGLQTFIWTIVSNIVDVIFRLIGLASVGFIIWGGWKYMLARGEPSKMAAAKTTITHAITGLVIGILGVAIVNVVMGIVYA